MKSCLVQNLFEVLNVSGSIGYPFRFGFGLDNTHNPKYHKTRPIRYLRRIRIGSDLFLSDRIRFGFSGLVYLPSPTSGFQHDLKGLIYCKINKKRGIEPLCSLGGIRAITSLKNPQVPMQPLGPNTPGSRYDL